MIGNLTGGKYEFFQSRPPYRIGLGTNGKAREKALFDIGVNTLADFQALNGQTNQIKSILAQIPLTTGETPCRIVGEAALKNYIAKCSSGILPDEEPPPSINFLLKILIPTKLGTETIGRMRLGNLNFTRITVVSPT